MRSPRRTLRPQEIRDIMQDITLLTNRCACGWEVPAVFALLDDCQPSQEVNLMCPICQCPTRAKVMKAE
jgi:hypothetical protein